MKKLMLVSLIVALSGCSSTWTEDTYIRAKAGYKLQESEIFWFEPGSAEMTESHPLACSISVGKEFGNWFVELAHNSQCLEGKPFNNDPEYSKTEIAIGYEFRF